MSLTDTGRPTAASSAVPKSGLMKRFLGNELVFRPGDPNRRLRMLSVALVAIMGIFALRLLYVQVIDGASFAQRAEATRLATSTLTAPRGTLYDANGVPLAESVDGRNIIVDQTLIEDPEAVAAQIAPALGIPVEDLQPSLTGDSRFAYVARGVSPKAAAEIADMELPGLASEPTQRRLYPAGEIGANVIGFVGTDGHGLAGLELAYEEQLAGVDGMREVEVANGKLIPMGTDNQDPAVPGTSLQLTIDRDIQWAAQNAIAAQVASSGAQSGTVIVMEVKTGKVLAMASVPTFDPNSPTESRDEDLQNRAVVEAFEPGSTSKLMTVAAALEEGAVTPDTGFTVPSTITRGTNDFSDFSPHPTYQLTTAGILAMSSNTGSIMLAERVGEEKFRDYMLRFGMGAPTGVELPGEASGYVPPISQWTDSTFPTLSFGQGFSASALQITSVFQTIANGGVRIQPSLVTGTIDPDGRQRPAPEPEATEVVSPETADAVLHMMEGVVSDDGTAKDAQVAGYRVAGKTGTANRIDDSCGCYRGYTSSFVGVAPADDPELVVAVIVQDPKSDYRGSANGVPVFNDVMSTALQMHRIPPTGAEEPLLPIHVPGTEPE